MAKPIDKEYLETNLKNFYNEKLKTKIDNNSASEVTDETVYDSTEAPIIAFKGNGYTEQKQYSGKNLLKNNLTSATSSGVTFSTNSDGSITANGTSTATFTGCYADILNTTDFSDLIKIGETYIFSANSTDDSHNLRLYGLYQDSSTNTMHSLFNPTVTEVRVTIPNNANKIIIRAVCYSNGATLSNEKIYPMVRLASNTDSTYEPYVGGTASPNPDYPQPIHGYGDMGWFDGALVNGDYNSADGSIAESTYKLRSVNKILVKKGDIITFKTNNKNLQYWIASWDINGQYIVDNAPSWTDINESKTIQNDGYIAFSLKFTDTSAITPETAGHITVLKNGMYCAPVKSVGKNIFGGLPFAEALNKVSAESVIDKTNKTVTFNHIADDVKVLFNNFKKNTQYTFILNGSIIESTGKNTSIYLVYSDGNISNFVIEGSENKNYKITSESGRDVSSLCLEWQHGGNAILNYEQCGIFEGVITEAEFEPYQESTALIPTTQPFYEGDYIQLNADGTGVEHRENGVTIYNGDESLNISGDNTLENPETIYFGEVDRMEYADYYGYFYCNNFLKTPIWNVDNEGMSYEGSSGHNSMRFRIKKSRLESEDVAGFKKWLSKNPTIVVYKLKTPTDTPLTLDQLQEIKKLTSFNNQTTFSTDPYHPTIEVEYYKNTDNGKVVGGLEVKTNNSIEKIDNQLSNQLSGLTFSIAGAELEILDKDGMRYYLDISRIIPPPTS